MLGPYELPTEQIEWGIRIGYLLEQAEAAPSSGGKTDEREK
jgi:hypothetical protein